MSFDRRIFGAVVLAAMLGAVPAKAEKQPGVTGIVQDQSSK